LNINSENDHFYFNVILLKNKKKLILRVTKLRPPPHSQWLARRARASFKKIEKFKCKFMVLPRPTKTLVAPLLTPS